MADRFNRPVWRAHITPFSLEVTFPNLPVWKGTYETPGLRACLPLRLGADGSGSVRQIADDVTRQAITAAYSEAGYSHITTLPGTSNWGRNLASRKIALIDELLGKVSGDVLDIGGGNFYLPSFLVERDRPSSYTLLEPSIAVAPTQGISVIRGYFPDSVPNFEADTVLAFGVLEHVPDPLAFLRAVNAILSKRKNSRALLYFPTTEYQMLSGDLGVLEHEHFSFFTRTSVERLFSRAGLRPEAIIEKEHNITARLVPCDPIVDTEESLDPFLIDSIKAFQSSLASGKTALEEALNQGQVAFHGANGALEKFLHVTELGNHPGIEIFDLDEKKVGRFIQSHNKAIRHTSDPEYAKMPTVFVSAMVFFEEIRASLIKDHSRAGATIKPLFRA